MARTIQAGAALAMAAVLAINVVALTAGQDAGPRDVVVQRLTVEGRRSATPSIAAQGDFVAVAWSATAPGGSSDVYLAVSRDGGAQFAAPVRVNDQPGEARNGGEMPPRVSLVSSIDRPAVAGDPEVVVVWRARTPTTSIRYARSRDGGRSFSAAATLQAPEATGERGWHTSAVAADGSVHALWLDHRGLAPTGGADGGHAAHRKAAQADGSFDGVAMAQRSGVYYAAIGDGSPVERELAKGVCYCCKTALAAGPNGALYAAWRHVYEGNIRDIAFAASADNGRTFGAPTRVSEDRWQLAGCPDDGPAMAVDGQGVVHVVWPTVIGGDRPEGAIFHSSTRDGRTFAPRVRVPTLGSPKPSHPQIALTADGRVVIAWDESLDGVRRAAVSVMSNGNGDGAAFSTPVQVEPSNSTSPAAAVYPALATTPRQILVAWTSGSGESTTIGVRRLPSTMTLSSR